MTRRSPRRPRYGRRSLRGSLLLVVNSSARRSPPGARVVTRALADHDVTVAETTRRGHATRLAQGAAADGVDVVVVLGGDGTLNEAANGLAGTDTALGPLPGGSTNVFARTLGLPDDPIEAALRRLAWPTRCPGRPGLGERPLLPLPRRHRVRRRGGRRGRAAGSLKRWANHVLFIYALLKTWSVGLSPAPPSLQGAVCR